MTGLLYAFALYGAAVKISIASGALQSSGQDEEHVNAVIISGLVCDLVVASLTSTGWAIFQGLI